MVRLDKMWEYWDTQAENREKAYQEIAHARDKEHFNEMGENEMSEIFGYAKKFGLTNNLTVLDIGCGIGRMLLPLYKMNVAKRLIGVDVSEKMVEDAKRYCEGTPIEFYKSSGADLRQFEDAGFDMVYSFIVFQHMPKCLLPGYISEALRVLNKGGLFIFQIPTLEAYRLAYKQEPFTDVPDDNFRWMRYYDEEEVKGILEQFKDKCEVLENNARKIIVLRKL